MFAQRYRNRSEAGKILGRKLQAIDIPYDALVLGLPRGGVPVAQEVARALDLELDVLNLRKLGLPDHPEVAMGAIAEEGVRYLDWDLIDRLVVTPKQVEEVEKRERALLASRAQRYRDVRPAAEVAGRTVIVVDDGIATGATMELAVRVLRKRRAKRIIVATPVGPVGTTVRFSGLADQCVCLLEPQVFNSVGLWYVDFQQIPEELVVEALRDSQDSHQRRTSNALTANVSRH